MNNDETLERKEKIESDEKINKQANEGMTWSTQQVNILFPQLFIIKSNLNFSNFLKENLYFKFKFCFYLKEKNRN